MDKLEMLRGLRLQTWALGMTFWREGLFTVRWRIVAGIIAVLYAVWWYTADKRRILEILLFGSFIAVSRLIFDDWGTSTGRWAYITDLLPMGAISMTDLVIVPVTMMPVYQYTKSWGSFLILTAVTQAVIAFGFFPLLIRLGCLHVFQWPPYGSFLVSLGTAVIMRALIRFGLKVQRGDE